MIFGEAVALLLADYGVDTVFGIPGVHTIELYRGLPAAGITSHPARHEQGVGFMADAYARLTGKPGVCILVTGPGVLNALTPMAQAWHDSVPILIVAATTETALLGKNRGPLHDIPDQVGLVGALTEYSYLVESPERFPEVLALAWAGMTTGRPRPAHIAIPTDLLELKVDGPFQRFGAASNAREDSSLEANLAAAIDLLNSAAAPVIIAGGGSTHARDAVRRLAEALDAPVVNTGNASGVLPATHPLAVGTVLPFAAPQRLIRTADVVLALGTEFSSTDVIYSGSPIQVGGALIRVDIDPAQLEEPIPAAVGILGDCAVVLAELERRVTPRAGTESGAKRAAEARVIDDWTAQSVGHFPWLDAVSQALPANAITVLDSTQLAYTAHHYLPQLDGRSWIATYGLGTLGAALPMAVGAKITEPDRSVLAITGDGSSLFTLTELATAADLGRQLTVLIWDNGGYGEIRDSFDRANAERIDTEVTAFDFVTIARGFGARSVQVTTPEDLRDALAKSFSHDGLSVIVAVAPDTLRPPGKETPHNA